MDGKARERRMRVWLRVSSVVLTLALLFWFITSMGFTSSINVSIFVFVSSLIFEVIFILIILIPIYYFAWKKSQ